MPQPAKNSPTRPRWPLVALLALCTLWLAWRPIKHTTQNLLGTRRPDNIPWRTSLPDALHEARHAHRLLLVDFSASWCGPCQMMEEDTWPDPRVAAAIAQHFIPVQLDPDLPQNAPTLQRYQIEAYPTLLILDDAGTPQNSQIGALNADELLEFLKSSQH